MFHSWNKERRSQRVGKSPRLGIKNPDPYLATTRERVTPARSSSQAESRRPGSSKGDMGKLNSNYTMQN